MKKRILTAAFVLFLTVGVAFAQVRITVGPPPRPREVIPRPPREHRDWVWHPGYHRWDGRAYVWVPGEYVAPPHAHARWIRGHWDHRHGEWVWVEGHWR